MVTDINKNCESVRVLMDVYLVRRQESFEVATHLKTCSECRTVWADNLRLKGHLKRAVEKDFAPQSLIDSIKMQIRR